MNLRLLARTGSHPRKPSTNDRYFDERDHFTGSSRSGQAPNPVAESAVLTARHASKARHNRTICAQTTEQSIHSAHVNIRQDLISCQDGRKYSMADFRKAGEILSECSNAWIDMRHDNARRFGRMASVRLWPAQIVTDVSPFW